MDKDFFYFKKFKLRNRDAGLKINTDGVLLAAWSTLFDDEKTMDIGTASGVIAHILAYRNNSLIIAGIDIDKGAIEEAQFNAVLNQKSQLQFHHTSIQDYCLKNPNSKFDHIISNPPYFSGEEKNIAKHNSRLNLEDLFSFSSNQLETQGRLSIIIPKDKEVDADKLAIRNELSKTRRLQVRGKRSGPIIRTLLEYSKQQKDLQEDDIIYIREDYANEKENGYGAEYRKLTSFLYLNF